MVLISLSILVLMAHAILISPIGYRDPQQIYRIIREKSRVKGPMGTIVEWQSLRTQEYRYALLLGVTRFWEMFGVYRPLRYEKPVTAGEFDQFIHAGQVQSQSLLEQYLDSTPKSEPRLGGPPKETIEPDL
jgi:hypothetical protein